MTSTLHLVLDVAPNDADLSRASAEWQQPLRELQVDTLPALAKRCPINAEAFITLAAGVGLFSEEPATRDAQDSSRCCFSLARLVRRDYFVRPAAPGDLTRLCELEKLCWQHTRSSRQKIRARLETYPLGQFVLEKAGKVLGVIYSQRIADVEALDAHTAATVSGLHQPSGSIIQLLAVNIDPAVQSFGYGDQLLEFMLQRCALVAGVDRVVGVTLCRDYHGEPSLEQYIRREGENQDPILAFHAAHGASIVKLLPGYRPRDRANAGHGVLVSYDILHRAPRRRSAEASAATLNPPEVAQFVQDKVRQRLGADAGEFHLDRPLMEMGLDSADLLKLQQQLEEKLAQKFPAGFFFEYNSVRKVVDHLTRTSIASEGPAVPAAATSHTAADIAIVGLSCKLPGGIESPDALWQALSSGASLIGRIPEGRGPWPSAADMPGIDQGGFVHDVDAFDAGFFRMTRAETVITDPQQRMLLQLGWACLEDAGILPSTMRGTNTGVFIGASNCDYSRLVQEAGLEVQAHHGVGSSLAILANRLSYFFDFSGPSLNIDTACSSSLVALHTAIQSLRSGECAAALVGGVNLICHPDLSIAYHKAGMLAPDGRCKPFDASANGYVRSEGAVMLLIKPLASALADGDRIHAVIKGSAINHGGLAGGLTVPNPQKQSELLQAAWKNAGIAASDLSYIEAHGTGTSLGDPIEVQGIQAAFGREHSGTGKSCAIGSVKSNLGHLESAAGLAGLLKIVVCLRHRQLPPSIQFSRLNPKILLDGTPLYVQERLGNWTCGQPLLAGVSSFGSGGANAHAVLAEFPHDEIRTQNSDAGLFVLSATNEERLRAYAAQVSEWLDRSTGVDFADAIYTWQAGRTAMKQRLAIKATDFADLRDKLNGWLTGTPATADCWSGEAGADAVFEPQIVAQALRDKNLQQIGTLWTKGLDVDWRSLQSGRRACTSVPTYPFARERFWIDLPAAGAAGAAVLHPLLHANVSDLYQQVYQSTFGGEEFFLADHRVNLDNRGARPVLPAVAYLEMARAAIEKALPRHPESTVLELRDTLWSQPLLVDGQKQVRIELADDPENGSAQIEFEVRGENTNVLHCEGRAAFVAVPAPARLDLDALRAQLQNAGRDTADFYDSLARMGLVYGPAHRAVTGVHQTTRQSLARLNLPDALRSSHGDYLLHPSLMDGALQAAVALVANPKSGKALLPFALDSLRIFAAPGEGAFAWIRHGVEQHDSVRKLDIDLCDELGNVCIQMRGFSVREAKGEPALLADKSGMTCIVPHWNPYFHDVNSTPRSGRVLLIASDTDAFTWLQRTHADAEQLQLPASATIEQVRDALAQRHFEHLVWVAPDVAEGQSLIEAQQGGVLAVFRIAKALLDLGFADHELAWTLITRCAQRVRKDEAIQPAHAGVFGLVGSLAKEYPQWNLNLVDVDSLESVTAARCLSLPADKRGNGLACRQGEWLRQEFAEVPELPADRPVYYRQNGVYVVIGGAGGLGEAWSRFMIERFQARMVWIGREEINDTIRAKIDSLGRLGAAPLYVRADATDLEALQRASATIAQHFPAIHGVVHSAIILQDKSVQHMDEPRFRAGLSAKVDISVNLDRVFGAQPLDFMLFFSSVLSFIRSPGQSNYAAGCTFKDSFAASLRQARPYPVKVVNWGYWGRVGIVANDAHGKSMARLGFGSIDPEEGLAALQALIGSELDQVAIVKTAGRSIEDLVPTETLVRVPAAAAGAGEPLAPVSQRRPTAPEGGLQSPAMDTLLAELLAATLAAAQFQSVPAHQRWLDSSIRFLEQRKLPAVRSLAELWSEWDSNKASWEANPNLRAQVRLVEACLKALPDLLGGRARATDVMFPGSSMQLVEGIYRDNALADHFNEVLGDTLLACAQRSNAHGIRILEIGAGTGGTTARILPALEGLAIAEYCYTDVSRAFLMHGEEHYQPLLPTLTTALFDVSKPVAPQNVDAGGFDFVIATNVLHATPRIREALRNAKALLKSQGVLLLNEISTWSLFTHLTFGLLEGWWLHEDAATRLPGSPGLTPDKWAQVLAEEGFDAIAFPAPQSHQFGQQVIAARSDGWVRQPQDAAQPAVPVADTATVPASSLPDTDSQSALREAGAAYFRKLIAATLRIQPENIELRRPLGEYGLDSILIGQLNYQLRKVFPGISSTLFFEVQTIAALVDYFLTHRKTQLQAVLPANTGTGEPAEAWPPRAPAPERGQSKEVAAGSIFDVAIVGLSGRYPKAKDLGEFWDRLANGVNCITQVPAERWKWEDHFDAEKGKPGKIYSQWGGFLDGIDEFDPLFFKIAPKEAKRMDPQERLFLQSCYHAIEDAGYTPEGLGPVGKIGVFVGVMNSRYTPQPAHYSIANRVSYFFNFQGPSMAVDTACSSSLTAIHLALESLYSGMSDCVIAGGVNLIIDAVHYQELSELTMLSSGNECRAFGEHADGFVDAEGVGAIVLKPLANAERDGDHIYGVIKGSAINAGGKTNGYTVPNPLAQAALVTLALKRARVSADHVSYVEAHGTGTALGDPIEIAGLTRAFAGAGAATQYCAIGSLKSNIGHCESAAGIAGLTKVLLQLKHGQLVPSLHSAVPNPGIDFAQTPFRVQQSLAPWVRPRRAVDGVLREVPRIAGVSSFGAGGSNAHLIVEEYRPAPVEPRTRVSALVIPLSARTPEQLRQKAQDLLEHVRAESLELADVAYTLQTGREALEERFGMVVSSVAQLTEKLQAFIAGDKDIADTRQGRVKRHQESTLAATGLPLAELLGLWVQGAQVDWQELHASPRRVSLPPYPFAKERYWVDRAPVTVPATLHPLLHANTSDLGLQRYSSTFTGREFFFVDRTLPAMAHLEMARVALERATRSSDSDSAALELRDVHWARPVALRDAGPMHIALRGHGDAIDFEVYSGQGETELVHCQGSAAFSSQPAPAKIDIGALEARMTGARLDAGAMSATRAHLIYGVSMGDRQLLAQLRLPESLAASLGDYVLHPSLMEGAMQAASGLIEGWKSTKQTPGSPISLESLHVFWPCARDMVAWIRLGAANSSDDTYIRVDIDLCDAQGRVCVQMRGVRYAATPVRVTPAAPKPVALDERKKAIAVSLAAPVIALSAAPSNANAPSARRPAVTLSNPLESASPSGLSTSLSNHGTGIHELRADAPTEQVLQALATAAASDDIKVLIVSGAVARASRELCEAIAAFPVPTIAAVQADVSGDAFLACALCDFMVLDESANYSFSSVNEWRGPTAAEEALFAERLGFARACDFLHVSTVSTGADLREKGWTCPITPREDVETRARQLAADLAGKSQTALRLLKQHLSRPFHELVRNLAAPDAPVHDLAPQPESAGGNPVESTRCFSLSTPIDAADVLVVTIGDDDVWPRDLAHGLARTIARANASSNYKAIVFACECRDFLAYAPEGAYEEFRNLLLESRLPVIGALASNARGLGWLASQFFDACVYCTESGYSFDDTVAGLPVEREAAVMFPLRFGDCLGREIVLTGAGYSGADLRRRAGAVAVAARDSVLPAALKIARDWTRRPREEVVAWKRRMTSLIRARTAAAPQWPEPGLRDEAADAPAPLAPTPVPLESNVVSAIAHPDGILVVRMEDREAKNLFSDAFVAGVREVFAHIEQTPAYKAVVLTGYDTYFASGGTQETLLAIQEGKAKFTDFKIFQLPMECRVPVIAAMQGHGIGGGWSLGMFADLVLMSEESRYVSPYMDYGFTPGAGATLIFPRQIGHDLARESLLTAHSYTGAELRSRGVSLPVFARADVLPAAMSLARKIARAARRHLAGLKWQLTHAPRAALIDTYERELAMHEQTFVGQSAVVEQIQGNFVQAGNEQVAPAAPLVATPADNVSDDDALTAVKRDVRTLLAAELQMQENDVDEDVQFIDLGMDSIAAVTWVRKINEKYKLSMLATKVYSYPTLKQLSRFITDEARQRGTLPGKPAAVVTAVVRAVAPVVPPASTPAPVTVGDPAAHRVLVSWRHGSPARAAARPATAIAVIGIAGQFPQARNVEEFWQNIAAGRSCVTEIPAQRWNIDSYYSAGAAVPGKTNSRWMGALEDYDRFDPLFFSISPTEAENMDPQQRLFLEACWHAIENAGYDADALSGSKCGVFAGCANGDYQAISPDQRLSAQGFTGGANSILAARISYFLNLQGPCLSIDTACSSSLAALAAACDSLVAGGSDLALAGGVAVMATPEMHIKTSQAGMLSPDGRCFTFDQRANGFVPGEAVGVVMLKRLADAEKDGDLIYGVIEGWGVNQDGKTNGITAPNPESQTRLQQETYDRHQIDPANIQLIEAHGTGTKLGDPIEVEGLKGSFAKYTQKKRFCALGSVKSDIGHCLAAAGIAGFIKLVLALRERQLPPTINFERLNEHIELDDSPFYVNDRLQEWTLNGADRRRAAISAFGFSGTNVHVVLAEHASANQAIRPDVAAAAPTTHLIPLSARTTTQLQQKARDLLAFIRDAQGANREKIDLSRLARTLQVGRSAMEERTGFVVSSLDELTARLQEYVDGGVRSDAGVAQRNREITRMLGEDTDLKEMIVDRWIAQQKLSKLLDLWIKGVALDWNRLHGEVKAPRMRLPLYPFARERYWIDAPDPVETVAPQAAFLHPLLHANTSDFRQQRYQSNFSGAEFFLSDHRVRLDGDVRKVLPGVAYLEMARAAMTLASAGIPPSAVLELRNTVWLKPLVVAGSTSVSITLSASDEDEGDQVAFEICSGDAQVHCQGVANFIDAQAPARIELSRLEAQMTRGTLPPARLYAAFEQMGLHYGPAHRAVVAVEAGDNQLLARLRTPAFLAATRADYLLHPALMDCALQASVSLIADIDRSPGEPIVPFAMDSLRICSPEVLTADAGMFAWIRYTPGSRAGDEIVRLDIDVCDSRGIVGVAMRGFAVRVLGSTASGFDEAFYQRMIERILNEEVSAAEAAQMG
ncbi:MAG TPA: SDR family NAD(P)-dependent oxidoreductase [Steroidobacteraceae bacterium]|nr:SDR family NAD(P)-dependent oxidoreductase [Steroidobacteraceae bacterium]